MGVGRDTADAAPGVRTAGALSSLSLAARPPSRTAYKGQLATEGGRDQKKDSLTEAFR